MKYTFNWPKLSSLGKSEISRGQCVLKIFYFYISVIWGFKTSNVEKSREILALNGGKSMAKLLASKLAKLEPL